MLLKIFKGYKRLTSVSMKGTSAERSTKKGADRSPPRKRYAQKLSNNHEIAASSSLILCTPSIILWRISGRGCLQPDA